MKMENRMGSDDESRRHAARVKLERQLTLEGLADVDAGRVVDHKTIRAWADGLGTAVP
jgi:predicted transcriptional regulator